MKTALLALTVAATLTACGGGETSTYVEQEHFVDPTLDPVTGPSCGSGTSSDFTMGNYQSINCVWHCSTYKGVGHRYVSLTFAKSGGGAWHQSSEFVTYGICT